MSQIASGTTLLICGQNQKKRVGKLEEILAKFFPQSSSDSLKFNPNIIKITGKVGIDEVRNFKLKLSQKPYLGEIQVGVVEIEEITTEAANALLKLAEEPEKSTQLIIVVNSIAKLPPTIISRCQVIFTSDEIGETITENTVKDAKTLLLGEIKDKFLLADRLADNAGQGWIEKQILFWRQVFLLKIGIASNLNWQKLNFVNKVNLTQVLKILNNLLYIKKLLKLNVNQKLLFENFFLSTNLKS